LGRSGGPYASVAVAALLLVTAFTCLGSLALGQGVFALCGARQWSWLAAPVGFAAMILLAVPALHVPGRSTTVAALTAVLIVAGLALWLRRPEHRPPLGDVLAGAPVVLLVLVPFAAAGRGGTLGVSVNNDMGVHMLLAEAYRSQAVANVTPLLPDYPLGPHALVAAFVGLGVRTDLAFAGLTAAGPILLAWTALTSVPRVSWPGRAVTATVVGMPFLIAAYYGEASFKEVFEAQFVLATVLTVAGFGPQLGMRRWIPLALVLAGAVSVYSVQGLVWPAIVLGLWLFGRAAGALWRSGIGSAWEELRSELLPGALGVVVLIVVLIPQIPRVAKFISTSPNNNITKNNLGNLVGPLPGWEALGVWGNPDFRLPPLSPFTAGMWTAFVLALVIAGALWWVRSGRWWIPASGAAAFVVWAYANHTQSPYISAKALAIASPLLLLIAVVPLVQRTAPGSRWRLLAPLLALVLTARVVDSSWAALRISQVGPTAHLQELRSIQPRLGSQSVLFLGNDDFIRWELAGTHVTPAFINTVPVVRMRPEKAFALGQALDFDSVPAKTLNEFALVLTTRDSAGSEPPPQMQLVATTRNYALWRRVGTVEERGILNEGQSAAAILDCRTSAARALPKRGGVAAVRPPSVVVPVPPLAPDARATVTVPLGPGSWELETPYHSPLPIDVSAPGLRASLPADLELQGPRWPIGRVLLSQAESLPVTFHAVGQWLTPQLDAAIPAAVIATPVVPERVAPLRSACGKLVDWYRTK
jgi:hypothetical protein